MTDLNESLITCKGHDQRWEFHNCRFSMFLDVDFFDNEFLVGFFIFFYFLEQLDYPGSFLGIMLKVISKFLFLLLQVLDLFFQELGELLLTAVMFVDQFGFDDIKDAIEFICTFFIAS